MYNISFLIGLKNNLEYSQKFYENTRLFYPDVEIIFVSYGSIDGTNEWLDSLQDDNLKFFHSKESKTLSDTYNKAIEISTKDCVCFLHNDMVLGKNFLNSITGVLKEHKIIYYKTIEPPIFGKDERLWKEVLDFGDSFETFNYSAFYEYEENQESKEGEFTDNVSFFLACQKEIIANIGGLDPLFSPMFSEDDDLILRLRLSGESMFVDPNAITYHFVSKTSRFSEEFKNKTKQIESNSQRNFVRKWGFYNYSNAKAKYDVGVVLQNGTPEILSKIEPLATVTYVDFDFKDYLEKEQSKTSLSLDDRIKDIIKFKKHDVLVRINGSKFNTKTEKILNNLSDIIMQRVQLREYKLSVFKMIFQKIFKRYKPIITIEAGDRLERNLIVKNKV